MNNEIKLTQDNITDIIKKSEIDKDETGEFTQYLKKKNQDKNSIDNFNSILTTKNQFNNTNILMNVKVKLNIELGTKKMKIKDILSLGEGSIIEVGKQKKGSQVDIFLKNKVIAKGEVVIVGELFGARITKIIKD